MAWIRLSHQGIVWSFCLVNHAWRIFVISFQCRRSSDIRLSKIEFSPFDTCQTDKIARIDVTSGELAGDADIIGSHLDGTTFHHIARFRCSRVTAGDTSPLVTGIPEMVGIVQCRIRIPSLFVFHHPIVKAEIRDLHDRIGRKCEYFTNRPVHRQPIFVIRPRRQVSHHDQKVFSLITYFIRQHRLPSSFAHLAVFGFYLSFRYRSTDICTARPSGKLCQLDIRIRILDAQGPLFRLVKCRHIENTRPGKINNFRRVGSRLCDRTP